MIDSSVNPDRYSADRRNSVAMTERACEVAFEVLSGVELELILEYAAGRSLNYLHSKFRGNNSRKFHRGLAKLRKALEDDAIFQKLLSDSEAFHHDQ